MNKVRLLTFHPSALTCHVVSIRHHKSDAQDIVSMDFNSTYPEPHDLTSSL